MRSPKVQISDGNAFNPVALPGVLLGKQRSASGVAGVRDLTRKVQALGVVS
jgi:hypothetical protein